MKRQFLAMALGMATLAVAIVPSVSAGSATINIDAGTTTLSANGAYTNGVHFNLAVADDSTTSAKRLADDTAMAAGTDYINIYSTDNSDAWVVEATSSSFTDADTGNTYTMAATATTTAMRIEVEDTDNDSLAQDATVGAVTAVSDGTCGVVSGDVTFNATTAPVQLDGTADPVASFATTNADDCLSYNMQLLFPMDLDPITNGFGSSNTPTGTITFALQ